MQSVTVNTSRAKSPNADEVSTKIIDLSRILRKRLKTIFSYKSHVAEYREQSLLDENLGPEIRRIR